MKSAILSGHSKGDFHQVSLAADAKRQLRLIQERGVETIGRWYPRYLHISRRGERPSTHLQATSPPALPFRAVIFASISHSQQRGGEFWCKSQRSSANDQCQLSHQLRPVFYLADQHFLFPLAGHCPRDDPGNDTVGRTCASKSIRSEIGWALRSRQNRKTQSFLVK